MPDRIEAACRTDFLPAHRVSGTRDPSIIKWIVLHSTEGGTARSVAAYFESPSAGGSAHLVVDDDSCYRCLRNDQIPWGAPGANTTGFHIEQCGYARWPAAAWFLRHRTLRRAAYKTALHCKLFGIPPVFVDSGDLILGKRGVTVHSECSKAFGGDHTDPGKGWPRGVFMALVRNYYRKLP